MSSLPSRNLQCARLLAVALCTGPLLFSPILGHGPIEEQIRLLNARIAENPEGAELYLERGELHRVHRDWVAALADYERSRELDPALAEVDYCLGRMRLEAGEPHGAIVALTRFLRQRPQDAQALALRGRARSRTGNRLAAAEDFSRAIARWTAQSKKPPPEVFLERSRALVAAGDSHRAEALQGLEEGLNLLGNPVTLEIEALELELALGHRRVGLERLDRLARTSTRSEPWLHRRGRVLEEMGCAGAAEEAYRQALRAIDSLPARHRATRATRDLQAEIRSQLDNLPRADAKGGTCELERTAP